jgi:hypothetical protein
VFPDVVALRRLIIFSLLVEFSVLCGRWSGLGLVSRWWTLRLHLLTLLSLLLQQGGSRDQRSFMQLIWLVWVWVIWTERNQRLFKNSAQSAPFQKLSAIDFSFDGLDQVAFFLVVEYSISGIRG